MLSIVDCISTEFIVIFALFFPIFNGCVSVCVCVFVENMIGTFMRAKEWKENTKQFATDLFLASCCNILRNHLLAWNAGPKNWAITPYLNSVIYAWMRMFQNSSRKKSTIKSISANKISRHWIFSFGQNFECDFIRFSLGHLFFHPKILFIISKLFIFFLWIFKAVYKYKYIFKLLWGGKTCIMIRILISQVWRLFKSCLLNRNSWYF